MLGNADYVDENPLEYNQTTSNLVATFVGTNIVLYNLISLYKLR